jgi:hypothetical protein
MQTAAAAVAAPEASERPQPITVLYIAGWQRSGSTLLANILGQIEGFFSTGELYSLWDFVWRRNILCGCGARFHECPIWREVVRDAYGEGDAVDAAEMRRSALRAGSTRRLPYLYFDGTRKRTVPEGYLRNLGRLYAALARTTGSSVIVDSSKWPSYARMLDMLPGIELKVVHLVRDPRAVAHSWLRRTHLPDRAPDEHQDYMYRTPTDSSLHWGAWNVATEAFFGERLLRLRYEDFVRRPLASVRGILDFLGARPRRLPFASDRDVELSPTHTVAGNPVRLRSGKLHIAEDDEWRSRMRRRDAWWVTLLTLPLLHRYGYLGRNGHRGN